MYIIRQVLETSQQRFANTLSEHLEILQQTHLASMKKTESVNLKTNEDGT